MHLKISLIMLLIYIILLPAGMIFANILGMAGGNLIGFAAILMMLFKLAVLGLILLCASFFSDSIRAASAAYPGKSFGEIVRIGAKYFRPRLPMLLGIFILTYLPFLIIWAIAELLAAQSVAIMAGIFGVIFEFLFFQISSFTRAGQKLWYLFYFGRDFNSQNPGRFLPSQAELQLDK